MRVWRYSELGGNESKGRFDTVNVIGIGYEIGADGIGYASVKGFPQLIRRRRVFIAFLFVVYAVKLVSDELKRGELARVAFGLKANRFVNLADIVRRDGYPPQ